MALNVVSSDRLSTNVKTSNLGTYLSDTVGSNKNLIINGAFNIAQRGTTSTSSGFQTVDRFAVYYTGTDEAPTQAKHALTSSDTGPWAKGLRCSYHITNGNQTSGAGAGDYIYLSHKIEAQNMAQSGWDYTSSSSSVTLSFWIKSSVAQNFYGYLKTSDGTSQNYPFETGSLSADTWTKITKTIPGHANIQFDLDANMGVEVVIAPFFGTDKTGTITLNAWGAWASATRLPNNTSTWYTTNDSTLEITGVQLEVGDTATEFEHRSYCDELRRCQRYYQMYRKGTGSSLSTGLGFGYSASELDMPISFITPMRSTPSIDQGAGANYYQVEGSGIGGSAYIDNTWTMQMQTTNGCNLYVTPDTTLTVGSPYHVVMENASAYVAFVSEL